MSKWAITHVNYSKPKKHLFNELMMVMPVFWHTNSLI